MSIDSIKSKPPAKGGNKPQKKIHQNGSKKPTAVPPEGNDRKKMWFFTAVAIPLVAGLFIFSLKTNINRINQNQADNKVPEEIQNIKDRFNKIFEQTSDYVDNIELKAPTTSDSNAGLAPTSSSDLSEEQIKSLSDKIKDIIPTSTVEDSQP
jgi:hypothetical protein